MSKIGPLISVRTANNMGTLTIRWDIVGHDPIVSRGRNILVESDIFDTISLLNAWLLNSGTILRSSGNFWS